MEVTEAISTLNRYNLPRLRWRVPMPVPERRYELKRTTYQGYDSKNVMYKKPGSPVPVIIAIAGF
jgi:hypothetical protein